MTVPRPEEKRTDVTISPARSQPGLKCLIICSFEQQPRGEILSQLNLFLLQPRVHAIVKFAHLCLQVSSHETAKGSASWYSQEPRYLMPWLWLRHALTMDFVDSISSDVARAYKLVCHPQRRPWGGQSGR